MVAKDQPKAEEPSLAEVNRLVRGDPAPGTPSKTVDVEYALSVLRSENARLREAAKTNAEKQAASLRASQIDHDHTRRELHKVHTQLFESQQRVYALEKQLLAVRAAVNEQLMKEDAA
jgi:hypothetical protein